MKTDFPLPKLHKYKEQGSGEMEQLPRKPINLNIWRSKPGLQQVQCTPGRDPQTNLLCIVSYYFIYPKSLHRVHRFDSVFIIFAPLLPFKKHGEEYVARTGRCFFSHGGLVPVAESVYIIYETLHRRLPQTSRKK